MLKKAILASCIFFLTFLIYGCGQLSTTVKTSVPQPTGIIVRGTLFKWLYTGTNGGTGPFNHYGDPFPGAYVALDGNGSTWTTTTDARGEYRFIGVPDGTYQITCTAEGYQYRKPGRTITIKPSDRVSANGSVFTVPNFSWFDEHAYIINYSPTPGSIISNNQTFSVTFTSTMDTSTVRYHLATQGIRSLAGSGDTVDVALSWSQDNKTATISPNGNLISNEVYRLLLDYSDGPTSYYPIDIRGIPLIAKDVAPGSTTHGDILNYFADYRVVSGGVPSAPSNLQVLINDKITSEVDFPDVATAAKTVKLNWRSSASGSITGYKVYVAKSGSVLNYSPLESAASTNNFTVLNYFTSNISKVIKALYGAGETVDTIGTENYPFENNTVYFKVVAYNGDGESAGTVVSAKDSVGPRLMGVLFQGFVSLPLVIPHNYILNELSVDEVYIAFMGPVDPSTLSRSNFTLTKGGVAQSIISVDYITTFSDGTSIIKIKAGTSLNDVGVTYILTALPTLKDIAGNPVKVGVNDTVTWTPIL